MKKVSEEKVKAYSESSFQKSSKVRSKTHDQETKGIKKTTAEDSEEMKKVSEEKEKSYSESSFQKSSKVRSKTHDQDTNGIKKSTAEGSEEMKKFSEEMGKAYSEYLFQMNSKVRSKTHDQDTNGIKIDRQEDKQKFSMNVGHDGNKLVSEMNATPSDPYLKSSNATGNSSGSKNAKNQDDVSQNLMFKKSPVASTADKIEMPDNSSKDPTKEKAKSVSDFDEIKKNIFYKYPFMDTWSTSDKIYPTQPQKSYLEDYASKIFEEKKKKVDDPIQQTKTNLHFHRYASPSY
ncbi:unnamed protein product [Larinioides sclopetarius]|uniref:Uncharacterized protein n=1 Tax=Larinioides sclopetarius TaxID=280406 RepID=A0AAV2BT69_9ARAC